MMLRVKLPTLNEGGLTTSDKIIETKPGKIEQNRKSLISTFVSFETAIANV